MLRVDFLGTLDTGSGPDRGFQDEPQARAASWTVPVAHPGRVSVFGLPAGRYSVSLFLRGGEEGDSDEEELPPIAFTLGHEGDHAGGHEGAGVHAVMVTAPLSHVLEGGGLPESPGGSTLPPAVTSRTGQRLEITWHAAQEHDGSEHDDVSGCAKRCISHEACVGVLARGAESERKRSGSDAEDKGGHGRETTPCGLLLSSSAPPSLTQDLTCNARGETGASQAWEVWLKIPPGAQPAAITTARCLPLNYVCMYAS